MSGKQSLMGPFISAHIDKTYLRRVRCSALMPSLLLDCQDNSEFILNFLSMFLNCADFFILIIQFFH